MHYPTDLKYTRTHEWVRLSAGAALVGITDFAQEQLGEVLFVDLPAEGDTVQAGRPLCEVESIGAVFSVNSPVCGVVAEVNEALLDYPERLNEAPYDAWLVKLSQPSAPDGLMDAAAYEALIKSGV